MVRFSLCFVVCAAVFLASESQANVVGTFGIETWSSYSSGTGLLAQRNQPGRNYAPDRSSQYSDNSSSYDDGSQSSSRGAGRLLFRFGKFGVLLIVGGIYWLVKWSLFDD